MTHVAGFESVQNGFLRPVVRFDEWESGLHGVIFDVDNDSK